MGKRFTFTTGAVYRHQPLNTMPTGDHPTRCRARRLEEQTGPQGPPTDRGIRIRVPPGFHSRRAQKVTWGRTGPLSSRSRGPSIRAL